MHTIIIFWHHRSGYVLKFFFWIEKYQSQAFAIYSSWSEYCILLGFVQEVFWIHWNKYRFDILFLGTEKAHYLFIDWNFMFYTIIMIDLFSKDSYEIFCATAYCPAWLSHVCFMKNSWNTIIHRFNLPLLSVLF
jgi:hypothetical protein